MKNSELFFLQNKTNIFWDNWVWKTNVLNSILEVFNSGYWKAQSLITQWENNLYIEALFDEKWIESKVSFSYDLEKNKKQFLLNWKSVTKIKLNENSPKFVWFFPLTMNLFYLWPSQRRDFLDEILKNIYPKYWSLLKKYSQIVRNRNKILINIREWNSIVEELKFWDQQFFQISEVLYKYRFELVWEFENEIKNYLQAFNFKVKNIKFEYISKVSRYNVLWDLKNYLEKNIQRDIILWRTPIGIHIDDFDILLDNKKIIDFASRWELKTMIVILKLIEINFIQKKLWKEPILLIDDIVSELDENHLNLVLSYFKNLQIISTSIKKIEKEDVKNYYIST